MAQVPLSYHLRCMSLTSLWTLVTIFTLLPTVLHAQDVRPVTHATLVGIGASNQLDTYLSPLSYTGPQLHFMHETWRSTHLADSAISFQTLWHGNLSYTENAPAKARYMGGDIRFDALWHYHFRVGPVRLLAGPFIGANVGVLYHTRNGNNPAQALLSGHLGASGAAIYGFSIGHHRFVARFQLDIPLLGLMFSPDYGQSYYEIFSLGNRGHNVCFTNPFNAFSHRHQLTIDIPFKHFTIRTGYLCDIRQSHVNEIKHHSYSHAFMLGWVRHLHIVRPRRTTPPGFIL